MSVYNDGGPAFPVSGTQQDADFNGMSLRDWFAGQALNGVVAGCWSNSETIWPEKERLAQCAYDYADAMLAAREVKP